MEYLTAVMPQSPRSTYGSPSAGDPYLPTSGNSGYAVEHYDIDLDYRVTTNRLVATAVISARANQALERFSLDFAGLVVDRITVAGERPRKVSQTARKLVITPAVPLADGEPFEVVVRYRGSPHPIRSEWGEIGWEELADGVLVASQPSGASSWFPCNDHPSDKATLTLAVACESSYAVVSNGTLVSQATRSGRTRWLFAATEPMATYLATVQIGRYRTLDVLAAPVPTRIHFPPQLARNVATDFERLGEMIDLFSRLFGPYPFETYSVIVTPDELEIPLEAHRIAVFGHNHVDGAHGSDRLIAHELAHQWFGNSLTAGSWRDIWLHEGFACYAEWLWAEASGGATAEQSAREAWDRLEALPKNIEIGDPGPRAMFDDRVYKRGALALHALRQHLGDATFFAALRGYTLAHRWGTVTPQAFAAFVAASGVGEAVDDILRRWVYSRPLPPLTVV
jgi:aminopeptidase N